MEIGVKSSQIIGVAVGDRNDIAGVYLARAAVGPMLEIGNWNSSRHFIIVHIWRSLWHLVPFLLLEGRLVIIERTNKR